MAEFVTSNDSGKAGYNSNLIPMKRRCAAVSGYVLAVNRELKTATRVNVESQIETDSETSGPQPFTSKKMEHKQGKEYLEARNIPFFISFNAYFGNLPV